MSLLLLLQSEAGGGGGDPTEVRPMQNRGRSRARLWWLIIAAAGLSMACS